MIFSGIVSVTFRHLAPADIVRLAAEAGLYSVEWGGDVHVPHGDLARAREVSKRTQGAGLCVAAYGSYYRAGWSDQEGLAFECVLETAVALGAPAIRIWPGRSGSAQTDPATRSAIVADIRRCATLARLAGVDISLEFHANTLTDTNESATRLLRELADPAVRIHWQPHNGEDTETALAGLRDLAPSLGNLHVFHWWPSAAERHPLASGSERWRAFLDFARALPGDRHALLEFVVGDNLDQFRRDARTLQEWICDYHTEGRSPFLSTSSSGHRPI